MREQSRKTDVFAAVHADPIVSTLDSRQCTIDRVDLVLVALHSIERQVSLDVGSCAIGVAGGCCTQSVAVVDMKAALKQRSQQRPSLQQEFAQIGDLGRGERFGGHD